MRILIFIILSFGIYQLQAQSGLKKAEWFVDVDPGFNEANRLAFATDNDEVEWEIDLSGLDLGVHYLSTRVLDDKGIWSHTFTRAFLVLPPAQTGIIYAEYFIDSDPGFRNAISVPVSDDTSAWEIDLSDLEVGVHYLHVRTQQASGGWTHTLARAFLVLSPVQEGITYAEYFIDSDPGFRNAIPVPVRADTATWEIDLSGLEVGVHYLHVRTQQGSGGWTHTLTRAFLVAEEGESPIERIAYRYRNEQGEELQFSYVLDVPRHYIDLEFEPDTTGLLGGEDYELCFSVVTLDGTRSIERCLEFEAEGMPSSTSKIGEQIQVSFYPNPTSEHLFIDFPKEKWIKKWSIVDAQGIFLLQQKIEQSVQQLTIDTNELRKGYYSIILETKEGLIVRNIIIQ